MVALSSPPDPDESNTIRSSGNRGDFEIVIPQVYRRVTYLGREYHHNTDDLQNLVNGVRCPEKITGSFRQDGDPK